MPRWSTSLKTAPIEEPVTLEEAKAQCRVDQEASDEDVLVFNGLIAAAREHCEAFTGRALLTQTWYLKLDAFPCDGTPIELPRAPLQSVTAITYVDTNGVTQTWSSSLYQVAVPSGPRAQPARIQPAYAQYYPSTRDQMEAVTIEFVCGWTGPESIPEALKLGMKVAIDAWFHKRGDEPLSELVSEVPETAKLLWWPYVVQRW